jgi:hypothetical protein
MEESDGVAPVAVMVTVLEVVRVGLTRRDIVRRATASGKSK